MSEAAAAAAPAAALPATASSRIAFRPHADLPWLLLPEGLRMEVLMDAAVVRVPNTRAWFHGVISLRGVLLPLFDLGTWAGLREDRLASPQIVSIGSGPQACALRSDGMPMLLQVSADPAPDMRPGGAIAAYLDDGHDSAVGTAFPFDVVRWLAVETRHVAAESGTMLGV